MNRKIKISDWEISNMEGEWEFSQNEILREYHRLDFGNDGIFYVNRLYKRKGDLFFVAEGELKTAEEDPCCTKIQPALLRIYLDWEKCAINNFSTTTAGQILLLPWDFFEIHTDVEEQGTDFSPARSMR